MNVASDYNVWRLIPVIVLPCQDGNWQLIYGVSLPRISWEVPCRMSKDGFVVTTCPLCGVEAKRFAATAHGHRYDCPTDKPFDITGSAEAELLASSIKALQERARIARERKRGPAIIPKIGTW